MRPIQTAGAQAVHGKGGIRRGLTRMLLALHAATRCLALSACLVFLVQRAGVIKLSVSPPAPRKHLIKKAYTDRASSHAERREQTRPQTRSAVARQGRP